MKHDKLVRHDQQHTTEQHAHHHEHHHYPAVVQQWGANVKNIVIAGVIGAAAADFGLHGTDSTVVVVAKDLIEATGKAFKSERPAAPASQKPIIFQQMVGDTATTHRLLDMVAQGREKTIDSTKQSLSVAADSTVVLSGFPADSARNNFGGNGDTLLKTRTDTVPAATSPGAIIPNPMQ